MVSGFGGRLSVDFGTTHTVASLMLPGGRVHPLLFDSNPLLSSAVFAHDDGRLLVGQDAERNARLDPTRFEPNPKRRIDEGSLLLGTREYPVVDVIGAVLGRVTGEAARVGGGTPQATVLTYPATWAGPRKRILAEAASRAGLPSVTLIPEPVSAATYFTAVLGHQVPPGFALVMYDLGGGTFDTAVVRRRPDGGWDILAADGLDDLGGVDLDAAIVEHLGGQLAARDPARWQYLRNPTDLAGRRHLRALRDDVLQAKEQLSRASSAAVHIPVFDADLHITREEFERLARPFLERTVQLTAAALARTGLPPSWVAGFFLVGGSSRIPLVNTLLHQRFGVAPVLIEQPELVVAQGGLYAPIPAVPGSPPGTVSPASPVSPPPTVLPTTLTPTTLTPTAPVSGAPGSALPVSGAPVSAAPISAAPTSASPISASPISASPISASPMSASPMSPVPESPAGPPPAAGFPAPTSPSPLYPSAKGQAAPPSGALVQPPPARRRALNRPLVLVAAGLVLLALCGFGIFKIGATLTDNWHLTSSDRNSGGGTGGGTGNSGATRSGGAGQRTQEVTVNKTVAYAGLKITVEKANVAPDKDFANHSVVTADLRVENVSARPTNLGSLGLGGQFATLMLDGKAYPCEFPSISEIPGGTATKAQLAFRADAAVRDLTAGVIAFGTGEQTQPSVPLRGDGKVVEAAPKSLLSAPKTIEVVGTRITVSGCDLRADFVDDHKQAKKGALLISCLFTVQSLAGANAAINLESPSEFRLKYPDGTETPATYGFMNDTLAPGAIMRDKPLGWEIPWPAKPGDVYALRLSELGLQENAKPTAQNTVELPLSVS